MDFVKYYSVPLIIAIGCIGNIFGLVVLIKGKLKDIGPILIYKFLFIMDTYYIFQILRPYFNNAFGLNLVTLSRIACKVYYYFNYQGAAVSAFMLIYISLEKYIRIAHPAQRRIMINKKYQIIYIFCVLFYTLAYALAIPFSMSLIAYNQTNSNETIINYVCDFVSYDAQLIASYLDLINREFIPVVLNICSSYLLISVILKSRSRVASSSRVQRKNNRHIKLALNCFFMNAVFILLNTPISVIFFFPNVFSPDILFRLAGFMWYLSYCLNFYIILAVNSVFRKEFLRIFLRIRPTKINQGTGNDIQMRTF